MNTLPVDGANKGPDLTKIPSIATSSHGKPLSAGPRSPTGSVREGDYTRLLYHV